MSFTVLSLDLSLAHTAARWGRAEEGESWRLDTEAKNIEGVKRLVHIRDQIRETIAFHKPDIVVLEGYSFASSNGAHQIGELGGVVRVDLAEINEVKSWTLVTPQTRAKFATGNPKAAKNLVTSAVSARTGMVFETDDDSDAFVLWCMGREAYGLVHPLEGVPKLNKEAMNAVDWPDWLELKPRYEYAPKKVRKKTQASRTRRAKAEEAVA